MNKIVLIGRLTKTPEFRNTINGVSVCQFSLAVTRNFKNQEGEYEADFINCVTYRKLAETIAGHVRKGDKLAVEGRLQVRNYDNSEGKKVYITEVVVENIDFLESRKKEEKIEVKEESDPFAEFSSQIELTDDDIAF